MNVWLYVNELQIKNGGKYTYRGKGRNLKVGKYPIGIV